MALRLRSGLARPLGICRVTRLSTISTLRRHPGHRLLATAATPETTRDSASSESSSPPPPSSGSSPPPQGENPPPPSDGNASAPPPNRGLKCGGFFWAVDPNIGLWNDKQNPNWRLTFTDDATNQKQRMPYAFVIQQKGPHVDLAVRFQFGFVMAESPFEKIPQTFDVESGWEVSVPLPLQAIRLGQTVIRPPGSTASATVWCIDYSIGLSLGVQKAISGTGVRGTPEQTWRGDVAMGAFVLACLWALYQLVSLPSIWLDFLEELEHFDDDPALVMFEAMDVDRDGYISREDLHAFVRSGGLSELAGNQQINVDELYNHMDPTGSGRVDFEQFEKFMQAAQAAEKQAQAYDGGAGLGGGPMRGPRPGTVPLQPFGGAYQPLPGGMGMPTAPGAFSPQPFGGSFQAGSPGLGSPGPRPSAW